MLRKTMTAQALAAKVGLSNAQGTDLLDGVVFTHSHFDTASGKLNDAGDKVVDAWVATKTAVSEKAGDARDKVAGACVATKDGASEKLAGARESANANTAKLHHAMKEHAESLFKNRKGEEEKTQGSFEWAGEKIGSSVQWAKESVVGDGGASAEPKSKAKKE